MSDLLTIDAFKPHQGKTFTLGAAPASRETVLTEVKPLQRHAYPGIQRDPFSLLFEEKAPSSLGQGTYLVSNQDFGSLDIFLVPLGPKGKDGAFVYQAVFN